MNCADACASILILTEDGAEGEDARATVKALVKQMLGLVMPGCRMDRITFLPRSAREEEAMRGSVWKSRKSRDYGAVLRLRKYIATKLLETNTFVMFHVDGDTPWAERSTSENVAKFNAFRELLPQVIESGRVSTRRTRRGRDVADVVAPPELQLQNLLLLCPFRSIEAWLYQNVDRARHICRRQHRGDHAHVLATWKAKRSDLDELPRPEREVCLRKEHNLELASHGFPAAVVYDLGKSFTQSVDRLKQCAALRSALARTLTSAAAD